MKEVTYEDWQKNTTPRMMWVWNDDFEEREKQKVVYVIKDDFASCPVLAVSKEDSSFCIYCHCAEISTRLGFTLEEVMQGNLDKLASRKERGVLHGSGDDR